MPESSDERLSSVFQELNQLSFKRQQLTDRCNVLNILIQFKKNSGQNETQYSKEQAELQRIEETLKELSDRKIHLEKVQEELNGHKRLIATSSTDVIFVESPPSIPAPQVILDVEQLPRTPSQTQCPFCQQYITTDVKTKVGSVSYLMCLISIMFGCVAGCCLIPFVLDTCKDVTHNCPKCRSHIYTCKKL